MTLGIGLINVPLDLWNSARTRFAENKHALPKFTRAIAKIRRRIVLFIASTVRHLTDASSAA
jgi:hypothetical protein